ncbi:MAG: hypothetical protein R3C32_05855 [Chloroflexota bacterium]
MDSVVLLLNADYEPLNVCDVRRAFRLVFGQKAEVIQYDHLDIVTARAIYRAPSVIRLQHRMRRPRPRVRLSRRGCSHATRTRASTAAARAAT